MLRSDGDDIVKSYTVAKDISIVFYKEERLALELARRLDIQVIYCKEICTSNSAITLVKDQG